MDEKKVAFIISTNNDLWYEECVWYIDQLYVPEGYTMDIIGVADANSMCEAYNAAMESSDAKYKVYLHHDLFIYYKNFIKDIVEIFQSDSKLGMIGMIGTDNLPADAVTWNIWDRGCTYACDRKGACELRYRQDDNKLYTYVTAIDGMLMATQYDVRWREDLALGWDFYDISQSLEFRRHGYHVGIPTQKEPWCMHDCGYSKLEHYDQARKIILEEYREFFDGSYVPVCNQEIQTLTEQVFERIKRCIENGEIELACQIRDMVKKESDLEVMYNNNEASSVCVRNI